MSCDFALYPLSPSEDQKLPPPLILTLGHVWLHYEVRRVSYSWKSTNIIRFTYMIGYWRRKLILKLPREIQNQIKTITKTALILFLFHVMNSSKICTFWKMVKANVKTIFQKQSKNLSSSCSNCLLRKPMCLSFVTTQHTKSNQSPISIETEKLTFFKLLIHWFFWSWICSILDHVTSRMYFRHVIVKTYVMLFCKSYMGRMRNDWRNLSLVFS